MQAYDNILDLLREKGAEAARKKQRGLILQPGAIGDCILTLPLAEFMKNSLRLGGVDILGHTEYVGILPGRTCIDSIRSIDSMDLHRLFAKTKSFELKDRDPLISAFSDYAWIATFLGGSNSNFEQNLIFTANCSRSSEVITLHLKPPKDFSQHIADFYIRQFINQSGLSLQPGQLQVSDGLITASDTDFKMGRELLREIGLDYNGKLVIIQPGSGGSKKCWHIDNFLAVAEELCSKGVEVIFLLGPAERDSFSNAKIKKINSVARSLMDLSLTQVVCLLSCADGFIGNDSGITHLAAALGIRVMAVFGPTNPVVYRPIGPTVTVFTGGSTTFSKEPSIRLQRKLLDIFII